MAITPSYANASAPHLAKFRVGESTYYLKDADLRAIVEAFGSATAKDSTDVVTSTGVALPTESAIYDFVVSQVGGLGKVVNLLSATDHTAVDTPAKGDLVVEASGKEYLYDGTAWREVGDETAYVLKTLEIAGITLSADISSAALSSALGLDALAFKSTASTTLNDYATSINGADYTPVGDISVELSQSATAASLTMGDFTPEGSVNVVLSQTSTAATLTKGDFTPQGTVSVTPTTSTVKVVTSDGATGTFDAGSYTAPSVSESSSSFATAGVTVSVGTGDDDDTLIFSAANTASALTATNFNAGSYSAPSLTGLKMPVTTELSVAVGIESATFTGSTATSAVVTGVSYDKATFSAATFTGSTAVSAVVTGVSYDKASVSAASFSGSSATITPTLVTGDKTVSVS